MNKMLATAAFALFAFAAQAQSPSTQDFVAKADQLSGASIGDVR